MGSAEVNKGLEVVLAVLDSRASVVHRFAKQGLIVCIIISTRSSYERALARRLDLRPLTRMDDGRRYSVLIELYDHSAEPSDSSPLHHNTATRLPPHLDAKLRAASSRLVLPRSSKDFWSLQLPSAAPLDTLVNSSPPAGPQRALSSPRVWSESFSSGPLSPPVIATAQLWTPSQPPPSAAAPTSGQQPRLDYRFGPLEVDWIDSPSPAPLRAPPMSPSLSAPSLPAPGPSDPVQWNPTSPRPAPIQLQPKPRSPPRSPETSGRTELNWGVVHLFRESGAAPEESSAKDKRKAMDEDDGTVVGMVSVPGILTAAAILAFVSPALESIAQLRLLRWVRRELDRRDGADQVEHGTGIRLRIGPSSYCASTRVSRSVRCSFETS